jgi:uncharacterized protein YjbI with pentapeptide repeats
MKKASTTIAAIIAAQCAAAQSGNGAAPAVRQLLETMVCSACDLRGADLSGARLDDAIVSYVSLRAAVICFTWLPNGQMYLLQQICP